MRRVICITASGAAATPTLIVIWSGSIGSIPAGWALCDGTNATPDLTDRFVLGDCDSYETLDDPSRSVGAATGTLGSHYHLGGDTEDEAGHVHAPHANWHYGGGDVAGTSSGGQTGALPHDHSIPNTPGGSAHHHTFSSTMASTDNAEVSTIPPYYALAYIAGNGDVPIGGMALVFLLDPYAEGVLPSGYVVCDGDNGTPDMWGQYVVGAGNEYLLNQPYGSYYLQVVAHAHGAGTLAVNSETAHTHQVANVGGIPNMQYTSYTDLSEVGTFFDWPYPTKNPLAAHHRHSLAGWSSSETTAATSHTHNVADGIVDSEVRAEGDIAQPPSYRLTWVMRVS